MSGFVYAIQSGTLVKIGWSARPHIRVNKISADAPDGAKIIGVIAGDRETESALHAQFAQHKHRGEWFRICDEIITAFAAGELFQRGKRQRGTDKLSVFMRENNLTEAELGRRTGISQSTINRIRNGVGNHTVSVLRRVAAATDGMVTPNELFAGLAPQKSIEAEGNAA